MIRSSPPDILVCTLQQNMKICCSQPHSAVIYTSTKCEPTSQYNYSQMIDACRIIYIKLFACIRYLKNVQQIHAHMYSYIYSMEKLDPGIQNTAIQKSEVGGT